MSSDETVGRTVTEYSENRKHLACVRKDLADWGKALSALGNTMQEYPEGVRVEDGNITVTRVSQVVATTYTQNIPPLDAERLDALLDDLRNTDNERKSLESTLRRMGLSDLIHD